MGKEQKELYQNYKNFDSNNVVLCFKKAESYENVLQKDLSEWTTMEIIDFYKSLCTPSVDFLYNIHSVYKAYTTWCLNENLLKDNINHYNEITMDVLLKCINKSIADKRIISREDLLNEIRKLKNPRDQFFCIACFEGFAGLEMEEIIKAKLSCFKDGIFYASTGREIPYSEELYKYAYEAANTFIYYAETSSGQIKEFEMLGDSDQVVKKVLSRDKDEQTEQVIKPQVIYVKLKDIQRITNIPAFTTKALKESGRIHLIKETVKNHPEWTPTDAIKREPKICYIYGNLISILSYVNKYNDFLK